MIELRDVSKRFGPFTAVHRVSFTVRPGEVVGLLGENGAGKTTTMRLIAGILRLSEGEIRIGDTLIDTSPMIARKRVGLLFGGDVGLYHRLTAWENIAFFGRLYGMKEADLREQIDRLSNHLGMGAYIERRVGAFSRGMKQKVAIARALVHNPAAILLDEPTTGLDVSGATVFRRLIVEMKREGKAILFSSHNMDEVEKLCDRVAIMHKGTIRYCGTLEQWLGSSGSNDLNERFMRMIEGGEQDAEPNGLDYVSEGADGPDS